MKPTRKRLAYVLVTVALVAVGVALVLVQLRDNIVFFYTPSEFRQKVHAPYPEVRVGGVVKPGSIHSCAAQESSVCTEFSLTDGIDELHVTYIGMTPPMFREEQGIVAKGVYDAQTARFRAKELLTKHDENYRPPAAAPSGKMLQPALGTGEAP